MSDARLVLTAIADAIATTFISIGEIATAATALLEDAAREGRSTCRADLAAVHPATHRLLRLHEGFSAGAGVVLAPDALSDASHWIEWWWADRGSGPERLEVDLDPDSVEFFDYTSAEWYRQPQLTGGRSIAGPYVDYICTHEYTYTLSLPLQVSGRFAGIAGADILADQVERAVVPALKRLEGVAVLASGNGRVIASNTAGFLPGSVLERHAAAEQLAPVGASAASALPWTLLEARG